MKKVLTFIIMTASAIVLALFVLVMLLNQKAFQRSIAGKIPGYKIDFDTIRINPLKNITVKNLYIKGSGFCAEGVNVDAKYRPARLLKKNIELFRINASRISLSPGEEKKEKKKKGFELPSIQEEAITVSDMSISLGAFEIEGVASVKDILFSGSIDASVIDSHFSVVKAEITTVPDLPVKAEISGNIKGNIFNDLAVSLSGSVTAGTYTLIMKKNDALIDAREYSVSLTSSGEIKKYATYSISGLSVKAEKEKIGFKLKRAEINAGNIKLRGFSLKELKGAINGLDAQYSADNILFFKLLQADITLKAGYTGAGFSAELNSETHAKAKNNDLTVDSVNKAKGKFGEFPFDIVQKLKGSIRSVGLKNIFDLKPEYRAEIAHSIIRGEGAIKGTPKKFSVNIGSKASVKEDIYGQNMDLVLDVLTENYVEDLAVKGNTKVHMNLASYKSSVMNLLRKELSAGIEYGFEKGILDLKASIDYDTSVKADIMLNIDTENKTYSASAPMLYVDMGRIPLRSFYIDKMEILKGEVFGNVSEIELTGFTKWSAKGTFTLKDLKPRGNNTSKIPAILLKENSIVLSASGDIASSFIEGKAVLNDRGKYIYGDIDFSYTDSIQTAKGTLALTSPKFFIPVFDDFLFKGALEMPVDITHRGRDIIVSGTVKADKVYLSSSMIKINGLSGNIPLSYDLEKAAAAKLPEPLYDPIYNLSSSQKRNFNLTVSRIYAGEYTLEDVKANIYINDFIDIRRFEVRFLGGYGNGSLLANQGMNFWAKIDFTDGYAYNLLKDATKEFSKEDTRINLHGNLYGNLNEINGFVKMPALGRMVLLSLLYTLDDGKNRQIEELKNKVKFLGYYPETIEANFDGSTMSLYVPLRKKGLNLINLPFAIQNVPIQKLIKLYR